VFLAQKQYEKAGISYEKAVSLNPKMFEPRFNQCLIAEYQGRKMDAIECHQMLMDDFPLQPEPFNNVGSFYLKGDNHKEAEQFFKKALGVDSGFKPALYNLSRLYVTLRQPAKALIHIEKIFESGIAPGGKADMEIVSGLCAMLGDDGSPGKAVKCYQTLLENAPNRPLDIFKLGIVLLQTGQEKDATVRFQQAYEMDPNNAYFKQFITPGDSSSDIRKNTK
jgi:tetratricopeptide (TPR) repeat protein